MPHCPRCGSSKTMVNGVLCPECISSEENQQNSDTALASPQETTKPYRWGKFQGAVLILTSLAAVGRSRGVGVDSPAFSVYLAASAFVIALGICILRRNRLILPLMGVFIILITLNVIGASLSHDQLGAAYAVEFVIWAICGVYYYKRRSEFKRWL